MSSRANHQPARDITTPEPGLFRMSLCRGGPPVAAEIVTKLGVLSATINGQPADVEHVWTSGTFIDRAEFDRLDANRPADPTKPVDFRAIGRSEITPIERPNRPVVDLAATLDPETLGAWLAHEYADHAARAEQLSAAYERFLMATHAGIADDDATGRATDFVKMHKAEIAAIDATRKRIKDPVLHAQRLIDGEGNKLTTPLKAQALTIENRIATYLATKAEAARAAQDISTPPPTLPDATRTRSLSGALTALKDNWVAELVDITKVPTAYLQVNDAAVKAAIRSGVRDIPGIRIWNDARAFVR